MRSYLADVDDEVTWQKNWHKDTDEDGVKVLVLVHRMAALRLNFTDVFDALNSSKSETLKEGFRDGTHWCVRPILKVLFPLGHKLINFF